MTPTPLKRWKGKKNLYVPPKPPRHFSPALQRSQSAYPQVTSLQKMQNSVASPKFALPKSQRETKTEQEPQMENQGSLYRPRPAQHEMDVNMLIDKSTQTNPNQPVSNTKQIIEGIEKTSTEAKKCRSSSMRRFLDSFKRRQQTKTVHSAVPYLVKESQTLGSALGKTLSLNSKRNGQRFWS